MLLTSFAYLVLFEGNLLSSQVDMLFDKTSLSPYVRFGCLSVRFFLAKVKQYASSNPAIEVVVKDLFSKLLQREFFITVASLVSLFVCVCVCIVSCPLVQ